jgi:hypothetical protein
MQTLQPQTQGISPAGRMDYSACFDSSESIYYLSGGRDINSCNQYYSYTATYNSVYFIYLNIISIVFEVTIFSDLHLLNVANLTWIKVVYDGP